MATLSSLPNELLIYIFTLVAVDVHAGHVTTTLSPVSKHFNNLIQSSGVDVIYTPLRSFDKMRRFLGYIEGKDTSQKMVHSLLLVVAGNEHDDTAGPTPALPVIQALLSTIDADASRLHTLFIHIPFCNGEAPILQLPTSLPALTSLHLSGLIATSPPAGQLYTPALTHLQLLRLHKQSIQYAKFSTLIHNLAPHATHLKLTLFAPQHALLQQLLRFHDTRIRIDTIEDPEYTPTSVSTNPFPSSLKQITGSFTCDTADRMSDTHYFSLLWQLCDETLVTLRRLGQKPPLVLMSQLPGDLDHVPGEGGKNGEEEVFLDCFVRTWVAISSGDEVPWSE
ncbi:hypothetical protein EIP91_004054 [Steccherinum ochraceum]|uniref:F-box domain-containing protein n=1 Tax=Steccherinum ochraceum TaxID=92696 RepID=A0A4R0R9G1_9APHY|nr:hypothetical protein EIP91_004054 [Steccherinum ochraceum]